VAVYDEDEGVITIWCGSQYAFRDQLQVARSLDWEPEKIRIIGSPSGALSGARMRSAPRFTPRFWRFILKNRFVFTGAEKNRLW